MKKAPVLILLIGIWLSLATDSVAFESDYISVKAEGDGPDVVLIHGFASSPEVWSELAKELQSGYRLHFVTIAGFAGAPAPQTAPESYLKTLREEIGRYLDEENLKNPTLIGHSMGGLTSLLVAKDKPDTVGKVVVLDSLPFLSLLFNPNATAKLVFPQAKAIENQLRSLNDDQFEKQAKSSISRLTKNDEKKEVLLKWSKESDRQVYAQCFRETMVYDARAELKDVKCPVTVLYAFDPAMRVPEAQLNRLYTAAYANLANASLHSVPESFHFIMWDQPDVLLKIVRETLAPGSVQSSDQTKK